MLAATGVSGGLQKAVISDPGRVEYYNLPYTTDFIGG